MKKKQGRGRVGGSWTLVTGEEEGEGWRDGGMKAKCPSGVERERKREREKKARVAMVTKLLITFIWPEMTRGDPAVFFFFFLCQGQFFRPRPSVSLECSILNYDACMCVYVCIHACRERWNLWTGSKDTLKRRWIRFQSCTDGSRFFFGAQVRGKVLWIFIFHQRGGVGIIVERVVVE